MLPTPAQRRRPHPVRRAALSCALSAVPTCRLWPCCCLLFLFTLQMQRLFFNVFATLCQDTDATVRKAACEQLPPIVRIASPDANGRCVSELLELLTDEEVTVCEALLVVDRWRRCCQAGALGGGFEGSVRGGRSLNCRCVSVGLRLTGPRCSWLRFALRR